MSTYIPRDHVKIRVITYVSFDEIVFPVYMFPSVYDASMEDGLLHVGDYIVDDVNMPGNTLGIRRLQSPHKAQLYKLSRPLYNLGEVIQNKKCSTYIDSSGVVFKYKRTRYALIESLTISKVAQKEDHSLLYFKGYDNKPWIIPRPPPRSMGFVTVLKLNGTILSLLRYTTLPEEPVKRKI